MSFQPASYQLQNFDRPIRCKTQQPLFENLQSKRVHLNDGRNTQQRQFCVISGCGAKEFVILRIKRALSAQSSRTHQRFR